MQVTQEMKSLASKCNAAVDSSTSTISNQVEHLSLQNFSQQCNTTTTHCTHSTNNEPTDEIARTQHTTAKTGMLLKDTGHTLYCPNLLFYCTPKIINFLAGARQIEKPFI